MRHTIGVWVENKFGVLARISGLFSGRGYNIESLTVAPITDEGMSYMTIVTRGDDAVIEQVLKQLNKLIDVIKVQDLTGKFFVERELVFCKVMPEPDKRNEVMQLVEIFRGRIIDASAKGFIIEITGTEEKTKAFISLVEPLGLKEIARTGSVAILRTDQTQP